MKLDQLKEFDIETDRAYWTISPHHPLFKMRLAQAKVSVSHLSPSEKLDDERDNWEMKRERLLRTPGSLAC
jgi:hypothetical protein